MNPLHRHLKRLPKACYQGHVCVHWCISMEDRKTGWLLPVFYYRFRELLTHTAFRYGVCCPIFCLMPDHMHLMWLGLRDNADQLIAMKYLRTQLCPVLSKLGTQLQDPAYDHVLKELERQPEAFEAIVEYIARNPERKSLVPVDGYQSYPYTSCLVPGYPDLNPFQADFWSLFDRLCGKLRSDWS
jgi:putative transposase